VTPCWPRTTILRSPRRVLLRQKFERPRKARNYAECAEIATISGQHSVDLTPLGHGGDRAVNQPKFEIFELGVEFKSPNKIRGQRQFVLVAGSRIEDLGDQFAHRGPLRSKKVINFSQDERRHDDESRQGQNRFIVGEARGVVGCAGKRPEESARIGNYRAIQSSRSRNNSDSSPSFVSVDSKRRVEGGRRPV
jgi:hypothetical protein